MIWGSDTTGSGRIFRECPKETQTSINHRRSSQSYSELPFVVGDIRHHGGDRPGGSPWGSDLPNDLLGRTDLGIGPAEPDSGRAQRRFW